MHTWIVNINNTYKCDFQKTDKFQEFQSYHLGNTASPHFAALMPPAGRSKNIIQNAKHECWQKTTTFPGCISNYI